MQHDANLANVAHHPARFNDTWLKVKRQRWIVLFVILPSFLAVIYFGFVASDIYVSEARFVIKSPDRRQTSSSSLANLIQTTGLSAGQEQTNQIIDYLRSRDALLQLSKRINVKASFNSPSVDRLSRFPAPFSEDTFENLYKFYDKMVVAKLDHDTNNAVLTVKAFNPRDAQRLNENLLELSEGLVNQLNTRANSHGISEAEKNLVEAEQRVRKARVALGQYRNSSALLDPKTEGEGVLEVTTGLITQRAALQAQLETISRAAPENPSIPALRQQIAAISAQIAGQTSRAVGGPSGIASKITGYDAVAVEQEFATQMLNAASARLAQARSDAEKQQFYLERIVEPNAPDQPLLPARLKQILTVVGVSLCLYLVGWMLIVGILEHSPNDQ